ncbi:MAG: hypothetical protein B6I36_07720 [Desulfobacteraceae bacterium 4572_35.1]|nr:MAG: hypothetical protein B6I36_07720 [Desulfobacteraceae bacterium 4572_35.1]
MSLINQMLKDLEDRRQQQGSGATQPVSIVPCPQPSRNRFRLMSAVALVVVVVGSIGGLWWYQQRQSVEEIEPQELVPPALEQPRTATVVLAETDEKSTASMEETTTVAVIDTNVVLVPADMDEVVDKSKVAVEKRVAARTTTEAAASIPTASVVDKAVKLPLASDVAGRAEAEPKTRKLITAIKVAETLTVENQIKRLQLRSDRALAQRNYDKAAKLLRQVLALEPGSPQQWRQLAVVYLQAGQLAAACQVADDGCAKYPHDKELRVFQARLLLETGNKTQALAALKLVAPLPAVAAASEYYALLASLQQQNGAAAEAQENYAALVAAFPQRGEWWIGRAICADQLGQRVAARNYFEQALRCTKLAPQLKQYALQQLNRLKG